MTLQNLEVYLLNDLKKINFVILQDRWSGTKRICPVIVEAGRGGDSCVSCAVRGGHAGLLKRLLAAGADANAAAAPPPDTVRAQRSSLLKKIAVS